MNTLVIPQSIWEKAKVYLQNENYGNFLFFFCGLNQNKNSVEFLVKDFAKISEEDIEIADDFSTQIKLPALLKITNRAYKEKVAIVEAHNHPSAETVTFSYTDLEGYEEFVPYVLDYLKKPYGATVWSNKSVDGMLWTQSFTNCQKIHNVRIVGRTIKNYSTTSGRKISTKKATSPNRFHRQILALGKLGQDQIRTKKVTIVGLGGIGSHIAQQLTYLGVRDFVLVDFDSIQVENLNRVIGAYPCDVGKAKVEIAARLINTISGNENTRIIKLQKNLQNVNVLNHIKNSDVIFGCVDNDGARLILNELSLAYMIPYFDSAFGIHLKKNVIDEAGGRVVLILPDGPCLLCCKDIDVSEASYFLATPEEQIFQKERGYVSGFNLPSPSVVSLDAIIASIAVTEFIALITGIREAIQYSSYDLLKQQLNKRLVKKDVNCVHCDLSGVGDASNLERYAIQKLTKREVK